MVAKRVAKKRTVKKSQAPNLSERFSKFFSQKNIPSSVRKTPYLSDLSPQILALLAVLILGSIVLLLFGNQIIRAWQERTSAAIVNGEVVPKDQLTRRLVQSYGEDTVQRLVNEVLVLQEGKKNNIVVTKDEIEKQIKDVEAQIAPEKLEDALAQRRLTRADLEGQIIIQLTAEKILGKDITITDEGILEYFNQNKSVLAEAKGKKEDELTLEEVKEEIRDQLRSREVSTKYNAWIDELRAKAQIQTFVTP